MLSASMGGPLVGQAQGSLVLAAVPIWLPIGIVVVFVVAAVTFEIVLARRVLREPDTGAAEEPSESDGAVEPTAAETEADTEPEGEGETEAEAGESEVGSETEAETGVTAEASAADGAADQREDALDATTRLAVTETVHSVLTQLGDRRLDHDEGERLTAAVAEEVARSVGANLDLDADDRGRLEETLRLEVGRQLTGDTDRDESLSVTAANAGH